MTDFFETPADTGVTQSDALPVTVGRAVSDTGVTGSDSVVKVASKVLADTLSFSDYIGVFSRRNIADTLTFSYTPVRFKRAFRTLSDTGSTISSQFVIKSFRFVSTTGSTITDSTGAAVTPAPDSPFTFLCTRNWILAETPRKWTPTVSRRFTYTTIGD